MNIPFGFPPTIADGGIPLWEGSGFRIGDEFTKVLQYSINNLGWNDELTFFHEESAGEQHFIDRASRDHAILQLQKHLKKINNPIILEIGCSSGFMLQRINKNFPHATIIGSDVVSEPLHQLAEKLPNIPLLRFDLLNCPLPDNSIDAIVILNVLEHIDQDSTALAQIYRILKPGGIAIIEVPSGPHLYDMYDKVLMHYRRYASADLNKLVKQHGFKVTENSHLGFFLYPGFWLVKHRNKRLETQLNQATKQLVKNNIKHTSRSKFLHILMRTELLLGKVISYPFGIRCLVSCVKPELSKITNKWPKTLQPLSPEQNAINDDFFQHWHNILASQSRYKFIENFNHSYATKHSPKDFITTLEIGAGLGEHLEYENLNKQQKENYVALELRKNMAEEIQKRHPGITIHIGDCQKELPFKDNHFDRVLAIHVLEHLPNLPACIKEMHRLIHKQNGVFSVVIPCEGGLAYRLARRVSAQRIFQKRYKLPYSLYIDNEHINKPHEILAELEQYFHIEHKKFFPLPLPSVNLNLCISLTLRPRSL